MRFLANEIDIKNYLEGKSGIAIYGMGEYGKRFFDLCSDSGIKIDCFIDKLSKESYKGVPAVKPEKATANQYVICSRLSYQDIYNQLLSDGVSEANIYIFMPMDGLVLELSDTKNAINYIKNRIDKVFYAAYKTVPTPGIRITNKIVSHCNLNCKGCTSFSPISEKWFADIEMYKRNMRRMSELFDGEAMQIGISGGEPLLHPDVMEFIKSARENFINSKIILLSNGLLLPKMGEDFWRDLRKLDVELFITQYPIELDYQAIKEKADSYNIRLVFDYVRFNRGEAEKEMFKFPLNLDGNSNPRWNYFNCHYSDRSTATLLQDGRIPRCPRTTYIGEFNKYFDQKVQLSKKDYIDIYSDTSAEEILEFIAKPSLLCRYCDVANIKYGLKWEPSKRDISEWV